MFNSLYPAPAANCDEQACHEDAVCLNGQCVCKEGFVGDGIDNCDGEKLFTLGFKKKKVFLVVSLRRVFCTFEVPTSLGYCH